MKKPKPKNELERLRDEIAAVRRSVPAYTMVSNAEFLALFQAHRNLHDEHAKLRARVFELEAKRK